MNLSQKRLNETLTALGASGASADVNDKRRSRRLEVRAHVDVQSYCDGNAGEKSPVEIRDISSHGVGFVTTRQFWKGTQFLLALPGKSGKPITPIICQVAHCRAAGPGMYRVGAAFLGPLKAVSAIRQMTANIQAASTPVPSAASTASALSMQEREELDRIRHSILD
jgi:hypothetical protein